MASPRQFKSSRLQERQAKEIEEARIRRRNAIANYWKHAYGNTSVCIESGESACKRIKVDVNCSDSHFDYSIYPDLIPFALPNEVEEYSLPKEFIDEVLNPKQRVRRVGDAIHVPYYKKLKRNYYYNLDIPRCIMKDEDIPTCSCRTQSGCDDNCQNKICYMECPPNYCPSLLSSKGHTSSRYSVVNDGVSDDSEDSDVSDDSDDGCKQRNYCKNTVIQRKNYPKTEVFATEGRGYGLRLCEDVSANTILIEYLGEVITTAEGVERMSNYSPSDDLYFAALGGGLMLDAGPMGSTARFANHSCDPSCELQRWNVRGESRLVLVSKAAMIKGSEITYNYKYFEDGLEKHMDSVVRQKCLCGAPRCAGTIGGKVVVSESDQWHTKAQHMLNGNKRYSLEQLQTHLDRCTSTSSPECQSIQDIILQGEEWLCKYSFYFITYMDTAPLAAPVAARGSLVSCGLPEAFVVNLLQEIPKNLRLDEAQRVDEMLKRCTRLEKAIRAVLASNNGSPRLEWKYLLYLLNELYSVLPISVSGAYDLLKMYQLWSVCTVKWLKNILVKRSYVDDGVCVDDSDRRKAFDTARLRDTLRFYGVEKVVSVEGLRYMALFENRVNTYMEKYGMRTGMGLVRKGDDVDVDLGKLVDSCMSGNVAVSPELNACDDCLHCFCQTTDELSEVKVFVACSECTKWYHSQCVNAIEGAAKSKQFNCPLCLHKQNIFSNFLWKSSTEWKFNEVDSKTNAVPLPTPPSIEYPLPPLSMTQFTMPSGSVPKSKAAVLTPQDLTCAIEEARAQVPVSDNPVEFLWTICRKYTDQWLQKVQLFFSKINISSYLHGPVTLFASVTSDALEEEASVLLTALRLYYELRVLRIYPDELVALRKLIWVVTARCITRHYEDDYNQITMHQLGEAVSSGAQLQCSDTSIWLSLNQLHQRCLSLLTRCNATDDNTIELDEVDGDINLINNHVHLTREYPVAKMKSVLLSRLRSTGGSSEEEYCWCRSPASECMICCEKCEEWFHIACVGLTTMTKAKKIDKFYCITCTDGAYPYQW